MVFFGRHCGFSEEGEIMKIFTHKLIIYHNGWIWKWEKKPEQKPKDIAFNIFLITLYGVALSFFL